MENFTRQNKYLFGVLFFIICLFLTSQSSFAQNIETQYTTAVKQGNSNKAGKLAYQIAQRYNRDGNTKQAINYLTEGLKFSGKVKDYENVGNMYSLLGIIYKNEKKYSSGIENYEKAAKAYTLLGNKKQVANAYYLGGLLYADAQQYDKAIFNLKETMRIATQANAGDLVVKSTDYLAKLYRQTGDKNNAALYEKVKEEIKNSAEEVITLEEKKDEFLKDSLTITDAELEKRKKEAEKLTTKQEISRQKIEELLQSNNLVSDSLTKDYNKKIAAIEAEKKASEKIFVFVVSSVVVILVLLVIFIMIQSKTVREKQKANKELATANHELAAKNEEIEQQKEVIEKEKERSESLLLNILPREIAEELKHNADLKPRSYDQVTVIFTDFKGFTQAAEILSPEELIDELSECFSEFDTICERWNLERIKTMGDAYMCAGGVPSPNYTNPVDAVSAAMEMQEVIEQLKQKKILQGKPYFDMRLGIHTGPVVAGVVGKKRFAYDIWGDAVNLAARMESSGEVGRVNISEYTYSLVRDYFFCSYRGKIQAKNKGEVDMYFVVSKF